MAEYKFMDAKIKYIAMVKGNIGYISGTLGKKGPIASIVLK